MEKGRVKKVASTTLGQSRGSICAEVIGRIRGVEVIRERGLQEVIYRVTGNSNDSNRRGQRNGQESKAGAGEREGAQPLLGMESSEAPSFWAEEEEGFLNKQDGQVDGSQKELGKRKVRSEIPR